MTSLNVFVQALAGQLGNCLAAGAVILLFTGLSAHLLRRGSSGARFAIWFSGLVGFGVVPPLAITWSLGTAHGIRLSNSPAAITLPSAWALYLFVGWAAIASVALGRIAIGFWQVLVLRRRSVRFDPKDLAPELRETLVQFQPARAVAILLSDEIQSPTAIGLLSPAIVLPRWLLQDLSTAELRQIFLHELAHLRRWDDWSNLLQKIVKALFFFHPAVWWMERQISLEREMACDEAVLAQTGDHRAYAQCLVSLAEKSFFRRSVMLAQAAVSRVGQTSLRVSRILSARGPSSAGTRKLIVPTFAVVLITCIVLLSRAPRLIAFQNNESESGVTRAQVVLPRLSAGEGSSVSSAVVNASYKPLAKISCRSLRAGAAAASARRVDMPARPDRSQNAVVEAKFGFTENHRGSAKIGNDAPSSEFLIVVVESRSDGYAVPAVWQIQMLHITVLRANPIPQTTPQKVI